MAILPVGKIFLHRTPDKAGVRAFNFLKGSVDLYKLIVVDDEKSARDLISECIDTADLGFSVSDGFSNGESALNYIKENPVDVVITDIKMPKMSGIELSEQIYRMNRQTKVIIVSGYSEFEYAKSALEYGVINYLLKPLKIAELFETLKRIKEILDNDKASNDISDLITEQREQFFTDLIMDEFKNNDEIRAVFKSLQFPFEIENITGHVLDIDIINYYSLNDWKYGKEAIQTAIFNILSDVFNSKYVYLAFHKGTRFIFALIKGSEIISQEVILDTLKKVLGITANVSKLVYFTKITENKSIILDFEQSDRLALKNSHLLIKSEDVIEDDVILNAKKFIDENFSEDITRDDAARFVFLNPAYFSRYFKQKTGQSFSEYLLNIRIKNAIIMLNSGVKIKDLPRRVGYNNSRYFLKNFKKITSYSPSEYKRFMMKNEDLEDENEDEE